MGTVQLILFIIGLVLFLAGLGAGCFAYIRDRQQQEWGSTTIGWILCLLGVVAGIGLTVSPAANKAAQFSDVPDELPVGHHASYKDYQWKVVIDPEDENWKFYADIEPTFSLQVTNEGDAQTVVCVKNAREEVDGGKDRYYTGDKPYCVGGEGKVRIIPQGTEIKY